MTMTARPRPQVMSLTEAAATRIRALTAASGKEVEGVRIGVKNLTNEEAPLTSDVAGYDPSVYNSVAMGRTWTLRLSKKF